MINVGNCGFRSKDIPGLMKKEVLSKSNKGKHRVVVGSPQKIYIKTSSKLSKKSDKQKADNMKSADPP